MPKQVSFIHAADLHLDSPFQGLADIPDVIFDEVRESTYIALQRVVSAAIERKVDFVMIVGDLFDNESQSLKAQIRLRKAFEELKRHNIKVYVSYGNHDHINGNIHPVTYPDNVTEFNSEQVNQSIFKKNGEPLAAIHGFSYENRVVLNNKVDEYRITDKTIPFQIGMLHGSIQNNTDHDTYAPFKLNQLLEKDFDYWALGHIHQRQLLKSNPPIIYSGNTQGRNRKESGERGCYHVILTETENDISFIPTQALQFNELTVDVSDCQEVHQIENKIQGKLRNQTTTPQLIDLILTSDNQQLGQWKSDLYLNEIIDLINETSINQTNWNYIFRLTVNHQSAPLNEVAYQGDYFIGELTKQFEEQSNHIYLTDLFKHPQGRKYLAKQSNAEQIHIKDEARRLLLNELLKTRGDFY